MGDAAEDFGDGRQYVAEGVGVVCDAEFVVGGYAGGVEVGVDLVVGEAGEINAWRWDWRGFLPVDGTD